jgi:hypothetical protein
MFEQCSQLPATSLDAAVREGGIYPFADDPQPRDLFSGESVKPAPVRELEQFFDDRFAAVVVRRDRAVGAVAERTPVAAWRGDE